MPLNLTDQAIQIYRRLWHDKIPTMLVNANKQSPIEDGSRGGIERSIGCERKVAGKNIEISNVDLRILQSMTWREQ